MKQHIDELLARIQALQDEVEEEYRRKREEFERKRSELAEEFLRQQHRYRVGLFRFLRRTRAASRQRTSVIRISSITAMPQRFARDWNACGGSMRKIGSGKTGYSTVNFSVDSL